MHGRGFFLFASLALPLIAAPVPAATVDRLDTTVVEPRNGFSISNVIRSVLPHIPVAHVEVRSPEPTTEHVVDEAEVISENEVGEGDELDERGWVSKNTGGSKRGWVSKGSGGSKRGYVSNNTGGSKRGWVSKGSGGSKRGYVSKNTGGS